QLLRETPLNAAQSEKIDIAMRATDDLLTVISDILDASRVERGTLAIEHTRFDVYTLIDNCAASFSQLARSKQLEFNLVWNGPWTNGLQVLGDPVRLRQVLANLLENAIKFTDQGGVTLTATWIDPEEGSAVLACEVRDTGMGIPAERLGEMFQLFEQMDRTSSRRHGGAGLGLSLTQRLVELMGGHIAVNSEIACGSAFRFMIPLEVAGVARPRDTQEATAASTEQRHKVLIVEDNLVNQRVAEALMQNLGFATHCAQNGAEAVDYLYRHHDEVQVVLMDCQMPIMDGWEATRRIREWEQQHGRNPLPIIAMTADALRGTEQRCRDAGMTDYMAKPVRKALLRDVLARQLIAGRGPHLS
ncbi:MAG: response regulator, partial [Gammaproteobacteria bacterium]|nr:response regulator [Gammaproteobacteria bacterium]